MQQLTLAPGERADVVVDFAGYSPNTEILLTNTAPAPFPGEDGVGVVANVMKFIVTSPTGHTAALPTTLTTLEPLQEANSVQARSFSLRKVADPCTGARWAINDLRFHDLTEFPVLGTTEVWSFINRSGAMHPMHMHLVLFQVLDRQSFAIAGDTIVPTGPRIPPAANETGWKDTVRVNTNEIVRVIARFEDFTGKYPYHCHILEHEDNEMMRQFEVVLPPEFTQIKRAGSDILLSFRPSLNRRHFVQRRNDLSAAPWSTFATNIQGGTNHITIPDSLGATGRHRFYRIGVDPE
jgi:spore coat protein A